MPGCEPREKSEDNIHDILGQSENQVCGRITFRESFWLRPCNAHATATLKTPFSPANQPSLCSPLSRADARAKGCTN